MKDVFKDAEVGDKVWSVVRGWGTIVENNSFDMDSSYPIEVKYYDNDEHNDGYYTTSGRNFVDDAYPDIFWKEGVVNEVTERPQSEIDWNKVPQGTLVMVKASANDMWVKHIFVVYVAKANYPFYVYDVCNIDQAECLEEYGYCKVHPDVEIKKEWLK